MQHENLSKQTRPFGRHKYKHQRQQQQQQQRPSRLGAKICDCNGKPVLPSSCMAGNWSCCTGVLFFSLICGRQGLCGVSGCVVPVVLRWSVVGGLKSNMRRRCYGILGDCSSLADSSWELVFASSNCRASISASVSLSYITTTLWRIRFWTLLAGNCNHTSRKL